MAKKPETLDSLVENLGPKLTQVLVNSCRQSEKKLLRDCSDTILRLFGDELSKAMSHDIMRIARTRANENLRVLEPEIQRAVDKAMGEAFKEELISQLKIGGSIQIIVQAKVEGHP